MRSVDVVALRTSLMFLVLNLFCITLYAVETEFPNTFLGKYGIRLQNNLEAYKNEYIGKTVKYIVGPYTTSFDKEFPGIIGVEYEILDVTGKGEVITLVMQEIGSKKKIKMPIRTANYSSMWNAKLKNTFNIGDVTIPLLLVDVFNEDKVKYVGKFLSPNTSTKLEVIDFYLTDTHYPKVMMKIKNHCDDSVFELDMAKNFDDLNYIGTIYRHPKVKAYYEVIATKHNEHKSLKGTTDELWLTMRNSVTGEIATWHSKYAETKCFEEDLRKSYVVTEMQVERDSDANIDNVGYKIMKDSLGNFLYADNNINVNLRVTDKRINLIMKNVSSNSMKIIWNESVYVDSYGNTSKIMHTGIKYVDREKDQLPTTIIKGAKINESVIPINNVYRNNYGEWSEKTLFLYEDKNNIAPVRLMLPVQVKDVVYEYIFIFDVEYGYIHPERIVNSNVLEL